MSKILVVDDNTDILMLLRVTFEDAGHEVVSTRDPFEALRLAGDVSPDAVVLDIMMPGLSGWDVLRQFRESERHATLPVVLLTALSDVNDRVRGLRGGADDYQIKPFEPQEILARVEGIISRRDLTATGAAAPIENEPSLEESLAELECRIAARRDVAGLHLDRYEVRALLGRGAMGTVLRVWDPKLERAVALKTIRLSAKGAARDSRERQVSRLLKEAVTNARINHPNIVTVYDVVHQGNAAFIAMELVRGESLESHLEQRGKIGCGRMIPLAAAVARALAAAHQQEIVHRDVKPANVLLGADGPIKVTDFGISEFFSRTSPDNSIFGTPGYLSPESLTGGVTTAASDLFSLGATLYECLAGLNPFVDRNWRRTLNNTLMKEPRPLEEFLPDLPREAAFMVGRLLEKKPSRRPDSATAVADLFEELAASNELQWVPETPKERRQRFRMSSTKSRLLTLDTLSETLSLGAAPA